MAGSTSATEEARVADRDVADRDVAVPVVADTAGATGEQDVDAGSGADLPARDAEPVPARPAGRNRRRWRRIALWTAAVLVVLLAAVVVDGVVLANRIRHVDIALPVTRPGTGSTYLVLGSDSRADVPAGTSPRIGTTTEVPGARADVVLVVHIRPDGSSVTLAVPRDLVVINDDGYPRRLTLTLLDGPQSTVNALCRSLGIPTSHLVTIDFAGFASVVDALGGVTVTVPHPVRDRITGLAIPAAGSVRLDGAQALALVRSRQPEQLIDGTWVAMTDAAGTAARTRWSGVVFDTLRQAAARARTNPVLLQRLAWTLTGAITTDSGTGVFDLLGLAGAASTPVDLPVTAPANPVLGAQITPDTKQALAAAGLDGGCTPRT